jgi:hypothetical protein
MGALPPPYSSLIKLIVDLAEVLPIDVLPDVRYPPLRFDFGRQSGIIAAQIHRIVAQQSGEEDMPWCR